MSVSEYTCVEEVMVKMQRKACMKFQWIYPKRYKPTNHPIRSVWSSFPLECNTKVDQTTQSERHFQNIGTCNYMLGLKCKFYQNLKSFQEIEPQENRVLST